MTRPARPLLFGHRGARGTMPENTVAAFARALADGANALELDVHRSRDGEVVVFHDDDGGRMANDPRPIESLDFATIAQWDLGHGFVEGGQRPFVGRGLRAPRLVDVLRAFPGVAINIDLKTSDAALREAAIAVIEAHGDVDRVVLASFHDEVINAVIASGCRCRVALARNAVAALRLLPGIVARRVLRPYIERGGSRVQVPPQTNGLRLDKPSFIDRAHDLGFAVDYWVINDLEQGQQLLLERGADGLISDFPARFAHLVPSALAP
jgi:glycerophosphoryl diester phosphodiesterase